jgi:MFS family permease
MDTLVSVLMFLAALRLIMANSFYIGLYTYTQGATSAHTAFYMLAVLAAGSVPGRLLPNLLAAKIGMYNVTIPCVYICGALTFALIGCTTLASIIVVSLMIGFFTGALLSLIPAIIVQLSPNRSVIGNRMGMAFGAASFAVLIGPPVSGNLVDNHGYHTAFAFAAAMMVAGASILVASRVCFGGWKVMKKM